MQRGASGGTGSRLTLYYISVGYRSRLLAALTSQRSSPCTAGSISHTAVSVPRLSCYCIMHQHTRGNIPPTNSARCNRCKGLGHVTDGPSLPPLLIEKILTGLTWQWGSLTSKDTNVFNNISKAKNYDLDFIRTRWDIPPNIRERSILRYA